MATAVTVTKTNNADIDGLLSGYKWSGTITYSFPDSPSDYAIPYSGGSSEPTTSGFASAPSQMQAAINYAIGLILSYTNANIQYAGTNGADIMVAQSPAANPTSYAYYPGNYAVGGDIWFGTAYNYSQAALGNYYFTTALHELGHALGLKHSQEAGGPANVAVPTAHDDSEYTVMSYRSYVGASTTSGYTNEAYGYPQTYMANDILALQTMYGANYTTQGGTTVYTWSPTTGQEFINGAGQPADNGGVGGSANRIYETIWDGGGVDTYDLSNYTTNLSINLNPGASSLFSSVQLANLGNGHYASGNVYNAYLYNGDARSYIDNATGGSGNDTIIGNAIANVLNGGSGNDTLTGGGGNDILSGDVSVFSFGSNGAVDRIADFNGDNKADVIQLNQNGMLDVWLSTGSGLDNYAQWGNGSQPSDKLGDFNGDGKTDVLQFSGGNAYVWISNSAGFNNYALWGSGFSPNDKFGDFNGDGKTDVLQFSGGNAYVWISNGAGFNNYALWGSGFSPNDQFGDFNGDHKADAIQFLGGNAYVWVSNSAGFNNYALWGSGFSPNDQFADFNGDGKTDVLQFSGGNAYVWVSNGAGFNNYALWGSGFSPNDKFGDFNGDGKTDVLQFSGGNAYVWISNGAGFNNYALWGSGFSPNDKFGDFNGDGKTDVIQFSGDTSYVWLSNGTSFAPYAAWGKGPGSGDGTGNDTFVFSANFGKDTITDFQAGPAVGDVIQFDHALFADFASVLSHTADDGHGNTVITYDANDTITLNHVLKVNLTANDFQIV
ncbi:M10 family metallopeptidase C-terminal domain-containing protein [Bradyrhizobium canariense]|uniref:M10 family metallopeptidase C-terminal domain-containing protein n=1 Tax=Bradyrhizobium canariense TaxID=255045 RepID=UPI001412188E|nr:M10 family metallopeptidase C-terminal domain-containing protein [Bradyrhizobium canariense]